MAGCLAAPLTVCYRRHLRPAAATAVPPPRPLWRCGCDPAPRCAARHLVRRLPARFKARYLHLHEELKYSDLTLFAGLLAVPVVVRLGVICLLDAYCSRTAAPPRPVPVARLHWD